ncbi:sigma-70 family RNA polymerase sigma factor [Rapidithrix thailandica]|uniref:Sigma-70 family RNA polymerase sigma factor n=1 Tax=Rapidithrix thailandica TaxID=413964 RepID=A0AAW9S5D6_9BACT
MLTPSKNTTDDASLWKAFQQSDQQAFAKIFHLYYPDLYNYGTKFIANEELVKDNLQELFIEIWAKRNALGTVKNIKGYLVKSLRRRLLQNLQKIKKQHSLTMEAREEQVLFQLSSEELKIKDEQNEELTRKLRQAFDRLNDTQKEVVYLRFFNNLDYKEISEVMALQYQSVRNAMHTAIKAFRKALLLFVYALLSYSKTL